MGDNRYWSIASCCWENLPVQPDFVMHEDMDEALRPVKEPVAVPQQRAAEEPEPADA